MDWTNPLFLSSGISGISLLIIGLIVRKYPSQEINDFYGYRSRRAKRNQESWDYAQFYSNDLMIWISVYNILIAFPGLFVSISDSWSLFYSLAFLFLSLGFLYWKTEDELKKKFGE